MPRITPVTGKDDLAPEHHYVFDQVMQVFGRVRGPFSVLLHSPKLAERLLPMVPFAREGTIVEPQLRQIRYWPRCASARQTMSGPPRSMSHAASACASR
jgi:hypothetical protein